MDHEEAEQPTTMKTTLTFPTVPERITPELSGTKFVNQQQQNMSRIPAFTPETCQRRHRNGDKNSCPEGTCAHARTHT